MKKVLKEKRKKLKLLFAGDVSQDDLLIGGHGNTEVKVKGNFQLSGIIYNPKYTVTLNIQGDGRIAFRGKCHTIVIKKMLGNCTLDLSDVTCRELRCEALQGSSVVIAGNVRAITPAILADDAELHVHEGQLVFSVLTSGNARIIYFRGTGVDSDTIARVVSQDSAA